MEIGSSSTAAHSSRGDKMPKANINMKFLLMTNKPARPNF